MHAGERPGSIRIEWPIERGASVTVFVDGDPLPAFEGESVATALRAGGINAFRISPRAGQPRGIFCCMGVCQECAVRVNGRTVTACTQPVYDGMRIQLGTHRG